MDFFTALALIASAFSEPELAPQLSTPIESEGGGYNGNECTVS